MSELQILLAEDNPGDILLVRKALDAQAIPYQLQVVRDGDEALTYVAEMGKRPELPCPDLLLLDLNLPKVDGPEILSAFRKHPRCVQTPVIVISSSDTDKDRKQMKALGITRYFRKPSGLKAFLEIGAIIREVCLPD